MTEMTVKKYLEPYYTLDRVALGSILETARKELDRPLSLQDVANRIGVFKGTVNNYEKGRSIPKEPQFSMLCKLYKIDKVDLINKTTILDRDKVLSKRYELLSTIRELQKEAAELKLLLETEKEKAMIETINNIVKEAIDNNIQDITIFPHGEDYEVAFRTADVKQVHDFISSEDADALFGHIKFIAEMDLTEKRCSQVRTCDYELDDGRVITIRISTIVNFQGLETMSIRLIHVNERRISLSEFDSSCMEEVLKQVLKQVRIPGLHVITGPAGVGKTTLAYSLLAEAFKEGKVMTIERHVEIKDVSFCQLQVNKANGMELEKLVTFVLRFNPDVLFIGEANTQEEVEAVLKAVSAGLSVVTTVHKDGFSIPHDVLEMKQGKDGKRNVALIK